MQKISQQIFLLSLSGLIITIAMFCSTGSLAEETVLKIGKVDTESDIRVFFTFSSTPQHSVNIRGKRIDVVFDDTKIKDNLNLFDSDSKIVKILPLEKNNKTIFSFFFRYIPQQANLKPGEVKNQIILTIIPGNKFSRSYPELATKLQGLILLQRETSDYANPYVASPYSNRWHAFFTEYEASLEIPVPVQFTLAPFPLITLLPGYEKNRELLSESSYQLARENLWGVMRKEILPLIDSEKDPENKKMLAFTYGEILAREGQFSGAYKQLYLLNKEYKTEPVGILSKYMLIWLHAVHKDAYLADFDLRNLEIDVTSANPLSPYLLLTQIETALATEQLDRMQVLLRKDHVGFPGKSEQIKELRQADYWFANKKFIKAYVGYQLIDKYDILPEHRYSLNGYCHTLYQQKKYKEAAACYHTLSDHIKDKLKLGMVSFRKRMAENHYSKPEAMENYFGRIEDTYPGTEAGFRAALKRTDLRFLTLKNWSDQAIRYYHALAEKAVNRDVREEAAFKEALVYYLIGEQEKSVKLLQTFLRDFRNGPLHQTGLALLIEAFPKVLKTYVKNEDYFKALVLAKQNKKLFLENWVSVNLLSDLAKSYHQLGVFNEATKLYLYLINLAKEPKKSSYYLPLIKTYHDQGNNAFVYDYADKYSYIYPHGKDSSKILLIRLQSLLSENKQEEALALLPEKLPDNIEFQLMAATLYFDRKDYQKTLSILTNKSTDAESRPPNWRFKQAESLYQTGKSAEAEKLFISLSTNNLYSDQSIYRRAQILHKKENRDAALKLFQLLAEKGISPLWKNLAVKELEITALETNN